MGTRLFVSVMAALACLTAWASEPGQPLDCSDRVFNDPGYTCNQLTTPGQSSTWGDLWNRGGHSVVDNQGRVIFIGHTIDNDRTEVVVFDGSRQWVLGSVQSRGLPGSDGSDVIAPQRAPEEHVWVDGEWVRRLLIPQRHMGADWIRDGGE
jgi:hypothetical protein